MSKLSILVLFIAILAVLISSVIVFLLHNQLKEQQLRLDVCNHTIQMQSAMLDDHE